MLKFTFHHKYSRCNSGPTLFVTNQPKILGKGWVEEHIIGLNIGDNVIPLLVVWLPKKYQAKTSLQSDKIMIFHNFWWNFTKWKIFKSLSFFLK